MRYRKFGKLDWKVSALGFGAMRLPVIGNDRSKIDEIESIRMIRYAIDQGVNYIDTAYPYHGGNSEILVGKALQGGYRERVRLATKMPIRLVNSQEDLKRIFEEQLTKLNTDRVDFYLFHGLRKERWSKINELNALKWAESEMRNGRIGYIGFSFHDEYEVFKEIIDGYEGWTFCQIQYNYVDSDYQAGTKGLKYAASKGVAVVVMEPLQGGILALPPPKEIQDIWGRAERRRTPADWAFQWLWNRPEVSVVLSGMSTINQVKENIDSANRSGLGTLSESELILISSVREKFLEYGFIGCTGCRYCVPCSSGVAIPDILSIYNEYLKYRGETDTLQTVKNEYYETIAYEHRVDKCVGCGECEERCPQQLPIRSLMTRASRSLA